MIQWGQGVDQSHHILLDIFVCSFDQINKVIGQLLTAAIHQITHYVRVEALLTLLNRISSRQSPSQRLQKQQLAPLILMHQIMFYFAKIQRQITDHCGGTSCTFKIKKFIVNN